MTESAATTIPAIGFISPPGWVDPSPAEFPTVCANRIAAQQVPLAAPDFDWRIDSVARMEPEIVKAAATLAEMGCTVAAVTGTPFAWAGTAGLDEARARPKRIAAAAGIETVMAGLAIIDALQALGAGKVALACTYYSAPWRALWEEFVAGAGFEVMARSLVDQDLWQEHDDANRAYWTPSDHDIRENVLRMVAEFGHADAVAVTGAGARTLGLIRELEANVKRPVIGADTSVYWAAAKAAGIALKLGALGALTEL